MGTEPEGRTVQRELYVLEGTVLRLVRLVLHEAERLDEEAGTGVEVAVLDDGVDRGGHAVIIAPDVRSDGLGRGKGPRAGQADASSAGFTSLQKMSIVRFASSRVMSPVGICNTM